MATNETATRFKSVVQKMNALGAAAFASVKKQNVIFGASFLAFVCMSLHIYDAPSPADDFYYELWCACMMACLFALPATLLTHKLPASLAYPVQILAAIAGGVLGFFAHRGFGNSVYSQLYYFGIFCAGVLVTVFVFIPKKKSENIFCYYF